MFSLFVLSLFFTSGNGVLMPMIKPDGSLDVYSLLNHIALLEQSIESKTSTDRTAQLESQLQTVLTDLKTTQGELKTAQGELNTTQGELNTTQGELKEVKSDLKSTEADVAVLQFQLKSSPSQCSCNVTTHTMPQQSTNISSLWADISTLKTDIFQLQSQRNVTEGALFTRWGRTTCPTDNKIVYKGYVGGTSYDAKASSASILCLPEHPLYAAHSSSSHPAMIYGTSYEGFPGTVFGSFDNEDMPCVVCESETKRSAIMVPARNQCYPGWSLEYSGYLMGAYNYYASAEIICVDKDPETIHGGHDIKDGQRLLIVESKCGPLSCPPYVDNWELTCSICTK